jgi:hypothetical protein
MEFLHRLDSLAGEAMLVETDAARLRGATFLDGRETFWTDDRIVALDPAFLLPRQPSPACFIFHVGFCGSTLLARLFDVPGSVLALKEPHCLVDIASQRVAVAAGRGIAPLDALLDHALGALARSTDSGGEALLVKPSNWVNSLLPSLCVPGRVEKAVFVSMQQRDFLRATFRGGRDRLAFCARLAADLAKTQEGGAALLEEAIGGAAAPLDQMARIVVLLHALQEGLFARAISARGWHRDEVWVDHAEVVDNPKAVLARAGAALGLKAVREREIAPRMERHAKDQGLAFSPTQRAAEDEEVERHHAARFDAALAWARDRNLPAG